MIQETPAREDIPGRDGIEVLQRQDQGGSRDENGTAEGADEDQLGLDDDEELDDLEDDAEGG